MAILGFERAPDGGSTPIPPVLDASQQAVLALADDRSAAVLGAPGTGKTTTIIELVADRVLNRGWSPDELVVLTPSRVSATRLRDRLALRLDRPTLGPMARTISSIAFQLVRDAASAAGDEEPRLLTGAEQDQILMELLAGEIEDGRDGYWPVELGRDVRALRGFRTELRDLMSRSVEYGLTPADLTRLGTRVGKPEWVAAAHFIEVYDQVKGSYRGRFFDSVELVHEAANLVARGAVGTGRLRLVILDDAQEATEATLVLLRALVASGVAVIAVGDPDITTGAYRGALPEVLGRLETLVGIDSVERLYLGEVHRHSNGIRELTSSITARIGTAAAGPQRRAGSAPGLASSSSIGYKVDSRAEEIALISRRLRERHLLDGVAWGDMAVIVRGSVTSVSRALQALEVPVSLSSARAVVRDEYAVRALVTVAELAVERLELDPEVATDLLLGPLGGLDAVGLRRLKAALRHEELLGDGGRGGDELLAEAVSNPGALATIDSGIGRRARRLADNIRAAREEAAAGATIEELLWGIWQRSELHKAWFDVSLGTGIVAEELNRHLDAIVALFSAAKRFVERSPDAGPAQFLDGWVGADLPEDTLAPRSQADSVSVGTPPSMIGREFDTVVIAGVQDSVWPNLRLRGTLLAAQHLAAAIDGAESELAGTRTEVMYDELRLFAEAVSRARTTVIVTAVANEDELPSPFLRLVAEGVAADLERHPLSLRGMVGQLRRELTTTRSAAAAAGLARMLAQGVPGAHPSSWYGLNQPSTTEPLVDLNVEDASVRVSPSRMEAFETCGLHWLIDEIGGGASTTAANLGTLIHAVADDPSVDHTPDALFEAVEARWGELAFESPWQSSVTKARARELTGNLASYLGDFDAAGGSLIGSEIDFTLADGPAVLRGKIDRVELFPDGTAVIVDLKTGKSDPYTSAGVVDHAQLGAYQLAFASGAIEGVPEGILSGGAKLVILSRATVRKRYADPAQAPFTGEQLEAFRERVVEDARGMARPVFVARIGSHCLDPWSFGRCRIHVIQAVSA